MYLSNKFVIGFSFGVLSIVGMHKIHYYILKYCESSYSSNDCNLQRKEDLEDDADETIFDAETGSELSSINTNIPSNISEMFDKLNKKILFMEQKFKTLEELYKGEVEKRASRELQLLRFEERCLMNIAQIRKVTNMSGLFEAVQKLQTIVEQQQSMIEKKYTYDDERLKEKLKALEELYRGEEEKKASRKPQLQRFEEYSLKNLPQTCKVKDIRDLSETVQKLQKAVEKQQLIIETKKNCDKELKSIKLDVMTVKNDLNTLNANIHDLRNQMKFIERNTETPNNKIGKLNSRIEIVEREVTNNYAHITGMNYSYQTFLSTRLSSGPAVSLVENHFQRNPPNASTSSSSITTMGSESLSSASNLPRPPPPPPPPTSISAVFAPPSAPPPPPPPGMSSTPSTSSEIKETARAAVPDKTTPTYFRIPITEEILKSVVLKPPGQRKIGKKVSTK